ncbi:hypothetical protein [Nitrosomonas sp.]|uniref:hypothetical protein n=1 Tax=Nitrosomonas sp. TaxID=42353 RepID=UPI002637DD34|nr:hypothetical protein [Nitrosomonas sp.]MCW5600295.1 hypothetical protein [Nitrosomonas sp.]
MNISKNLGNYFYKEDDRTHIADKHYIAKNREEACTYSRLDYLAAIVQCRLME